MSTLYSRGFTLLEVLVSGFILFLVVTTASMVFSGAIKAKLNAENSLRISAYAPLLTEHVMVEVKQNNLQGKGEFLGVSYRWSSERLAREPMISLSAGVEQGKVSVVSQRNALLWNVTLTLEEGRNRETFVFETVAWE